MQNCLENVFFDVVPGQDWHMQFSEQAALLYMLQRLSPDISLEIGTFPGGSLGPIPRLSRDVFTFDIDEN
jgi:hypothetical protein